MLIKKFLTILPGKSMLVPYVFALDRLDIYVRGTGHHTARRAVRRTRTGVLQLIFPGAVHAFQHVLPWDKFSIKHRKMVISYVSKISTALAAMLLDRCSVKKPSKPGSKVRPRDPGGMIVIWLYLSVSLYCFVCNPFRNICTELN